MSKTTQRKPLTHKPYTRKPYVRHYAPPIPKEERPRQAVLYSRVSSKDGQLTRISSDATSVDSVRTLGLTQQYTAARRE